MFWTIKGRNITRVLAVVLFIGITLGVCAWAFPVATQRALAVLSPTRKVPIYYVEKPADTKEIAISFDATWGADYTEQLLDTLAEHDIKTTFFLCGRWIQEYPEKTKLIADRGHEIGNHSLTHPHMTQINRSKMKHEILETHRLIKKITGQEANLFRCPFGEYNNAVIEACEETNYFAIQWDVDSLDWRSYADADFIYNRITEKVKPGSIVLFHNNGAHTAEALPRIITKLQAEGYKIVPISELLIKEDWYVDPISGMQKPR